MLPKLYSKQEHLKVSKEKFEREDFDDQDLRGWDFRGADLRDAVFTNGDLSGANFQGADLRGARFAGSIKAVRTDFRDANLASVKMNEIISFEFPIFRQADFRGAICLI